MDYLFFIVVDGMGGYVGGEIVSWSIVSCL